MKRFLAVGSALALALTLALSPLLTAGPAVAAPLLQADPPGSPPALHLNVGSFRPATGEAVALPPGLTVAAQNSQYWIVQFGGPVLSEWRTALEAEGAEIMAYLPDFAYKVRMNPGQAKKVEDLQDVVFVGPFEPAYKISPNLVVGDPALYRVRVEPGRDFGLTNAAIAASGAEIVSRDGDVLTVLAGSAQVAAIVQVADVAWIENWLLREKHNESGGGIIIGGATANDKGYDGSSQIAAVADTGFGGGTDISVHPDIPKARVVALQNFAGASSRGCYSVVNDGAVDVDSGHGTHVAGSVLSAGGANGVGRGVAPAAKFVGQAVENWVDFTSICALSYADGYYLMGIPDDLNTLFQQAYNVGARIHSNSWGSAAAGDYTLDSANADKFVWNNKDMVITFSAGNEGIDANADGAVDNDSTGSPATAKNVITVGASENQRVSYPCDTGLTYTSRDAYQSGQTCSSMGGNNLLGTYGGRWGADYPTAPLFDDLTAGNQEQMAAFSSRGPADDGRIKPDVVAPGTWILSTYSDSYQEGYDGGANPRNNVFQMDGWGMPANQQYKYFGGTSMSNPLAGGAATVVRDYYHKVHNLSASAALVKATLINTAVDLADENNDGANDNDFPIPNNHEGWGRIDLAAATDGSVNFVEGAGLATNGLASYTVRSTGNGPLKVSVVWSDFQASETASVNLVNDLDVTVTGPGGSPVYRGNVFTGGWGVTSGSADRRNNVENVYVQSPGIGIWTVEVRGYNVPSGPQPFALVVDNIDNTGITTAPAPATVNVHVGNLASSKTLGKKSWSATVTVTVHNANEGLVNGATVTGTWADATTATMSCSTDSSGTCSVTRSNIKSTSTTFTVDNIEGASMMYIPSSNDVSSSIKITR